LPKPEVDERQATASKKFNAAYQSAIENLPMGLKVWDITGDTVSIVLQDSKGLQKELSGRADFIISSNEAKCQGAIFENALCVIEIQSNHADAVACEYQLVSYLVILMNRNGLPRLAGILVYDNGTCRAYRASRNGEATIYEQNDTFPLYQIADILPELLNFI
jgi:hypothetical protein